MRPSGLLLKRDGITRSAVLIYEERLSIYNRDGGRCQACGEMVDVNSFEVAHRIANTVAFRKRYGSPVIDHPLNKATTHPGRCNSRMNIGNNPVECGRLVAKINDALKEIACGNDDSDIQ